MTRNGSRHATIDGLLWPIALAIVTTVGSTAAAFALLLQPVVIGG